MTKRYEWKQISQWDVPRPEFCKRHKKVKTGLSEATCTYLLTEIIDVNGDGYLRTQAIKESEVTPEMLEIAGNI